MIPKLRVARLTNVPGPLLHFYGNGLGLAESCSFSSHRGFDGVMPGLTLEGPDGYRVMLQSTDWEY